MRIRSEVTAGQCLFCLFSVFVDVCEACSAGDAISRTRSRGLSIARMFANVLQRFLFHRTGAIKISSAFGLSLCNPGEPRSGIPASLVRS